jgi:raffinose/stachyose/melibiose transport system substrate-binding protein
MDFPRPTQSDPVYGKNIAGPQYEKPSVGFQFGLTRSCKHPDVALDFLFFLASKKHNEQLNKIIGWIPAVKGCRMDPLLAAFQPHLDGVLPPYVANLFNIGGETWIKWLQCYSLFQVRNIDYESMMKMFLPFYIKNGLKDYQEQVRDARRGFQKNEQLTAGIRAKALPETDDQAASDWIRYVSLKVNRQIGSDIAYCYQDYIIRQKNSILPPNGPYEYSPKVLEIVRRHVQQKLDSTKK